MNYHCFWCGIERDEKFTLYDEATGCRFCSYDCYLRSFDYVPLSELTCDECYSPLNDDLDQVYINDDGQHFCCAKCAFQHMKKVRDKVYEEDKKEMDRIYASCPSHANVKS